MEPIFEAVLKGAVAVAQLLQRDPHAPQARAAKDTLVEEIPHHVYAGDTGLHLAAAALNEKVAFMLLEAGSDPNAQNRRGARPLHYACDLRPSGSAVWNPNAQAAVIRLFVERGADINAGDAGGATALHRAVRARSVAAVRQLLEMGARTDCWLKKQRSSPLHLATQSTGAGGTSGTQKEQFEIIELLLRHGADLNAIDVAGRTPLDWATSQQVRDSLKS
jgi:ankyrin repeat protein